MLYKPSGCFDINCVQTYSGQEPVSMDHAVVRYKFRPDIVWSDGEHLTAGDSKYANEIAAGLFPKVKSKISARTLHYTALDLSTIVWETIPGFLPPDYENSFFPLLPEHVWGALPVDEILQRDMVNRAPIGWGAYMAAEWVPGSHISLNINRHLKKRLHRFFTIRNQTASGKVYGIVR
jgi:peptide/nickel transport system substrate-binding protein